MYVCVLHTRTYVCMFHLCMYVCMHVDMQPKHIPTKTGPNKRCTYIYMHIYIRARMFGRLRLIVNCTTDMHIDTYTSRMYIHTAKSPFLKPVSSSWRAGVYCASYSRLLSTPSSFRSSFRNSVCMCACVYVCVCVYMRVYVYICVFAYVLCLIFALCQHSIFVSIKFSELGLYVCVFCMYACVCVQMRT
jgi:hypothetical protein